MSRELPNPQNTKVFCGFFGSELHSLERRKYSERSGSNIDNKYHGDPDPLMGVPPDTYISAAVRRIVCVS